MSRLIVYTLIVAVVVLHVDAHGVCVDPPSRGTCHTNSINNNKPRNPKIRAMYKPVYLDDCPRHDCPHCLNGGGKGAVMKAANGVWHPFEPLNKAAPFRHDSGMCGDAVSGDKPHEKGGIYAYPKSPIMKTYKTGSVVEFVVDATTNHNGFYEFFICDATKCGGDINDLCFKQGHCHQLERVKTPECESQASLECGPIDPKHPGRWYVPCRKGGHVGEHFMGGPYMKYKLPAGFSTKHAVLQWYWVTANSCNPPGFVEYFKQFPMEGWGTCPGDGGALGGRNPTIVKCGGGNFPEEFWNCADVAVTNSGVQPVPTETEDQEEKENDAMRQAPPSKKTTPTVKPTPKPRTTPPPKHTHTETSHKAAPAPAKPTEAASTVMNKMEPKKSATCVATWNQCGGVGFNGGSTCCSQKNRCVLLNKYYSQCVPETVKINRNK